MGILVSAFIIIGLCVILGIVLFISIFNWLEEKNIQSISLTLLIAFVSIGIIPIGLSYLLCYIIF
jgi:hypothetical protein